MKHLPLSALLVACLVGPTLGAPTTEKERQGIAFFEAKVRPVLVKHCYQCHSAEAKKNKKLRGGLLLDSREGTRKGGDSGQVIVPGKSKDSLLIRALHSSEKGKMPPSEKLPAALIADLTRWVDMGAPDPRDGAVLPAKRDIDILVGKKHWAFRPLLSSAPHEIRNADWARNPIDRFIGSRLEKGGLAPARQLEREQLLRRVSYDLIGMPPSPEELAAFLKDHSASAYERAVDRLLSSPHHGERWGRHWLDLARFAESGGYEFDGDRPGAYHYRDFVIKTLNDDLAYNQFVRLQLAGDHLEPDSFLATAATGFLVAGPYPGQTTAKTLEPIRYDHLDDMISTVGTSLLGVSVGCARCHEHKYDPIPQQDYYHLIANLARTDSMQRKLDPNPSRYRLAKADFDRAHAPLLAARTKFEKDELPALVAKWLTVEKARPTPDWLVLDPVMPAGPPAFKKQSDNSLVVTGRPDTVTVVAHTFQKGITSLRVEALTDASLPKTGPGRAPDGNFRLMEVRLTAAPLSPPGKTAPMVIKLRPGKATFEQPGHALGGKTGWSVGGATSKAHSAVFEAEKPINIADGTVLTVTLRFEKNLGIGRFRLSISTMPQPKLAGEARPQHGREALTVLLAQGGRPDGKHREQFLRWFRAVDAKTNEALAVVDRHALKAPVPQLVPVFSATSGRGGNVHYLIRGEVDRKNGVARTGFLQVLTNTSEGDRYWVSGKSKEGIPPRVALANWITDSKQGAGHLLARVIVNRLWQHHFGKGLVRTPNDFGAQGEPPTHPELLDWLASELIRDGWKLKPIHRLIVTSATYQQSGENAEALKSDPQNMLWARVPPRRLDAESIRDALLAVSGRLDTRMFGPGTLDENNERRSVYLTVKRSRLIPLLQVFDAPEGIQSVGERQTTTATTQALAMMNSRFVRTSAEQLARRAHPDRTAGLPLAVENAYILALGRRPTSAERERMVVYIGKLAEGEKGPRAQEQALTDFCHVLLCLNEFVYID